MLHLAESLSFGLNPVICDRNKHVIRERLAFKLIKAFKLYDTVHTEKDASPTR